MAAQQRESNANDQIEDRKVLKRRGILAAAGAAVAGIMAKQMAEPVAAATNDPMILGTGMSADTRTSVLNNAPATSPGPGLQGSRSPGTFSVSSSINAGVIGYISISPGLGVQGTATTGTGVGVGGYSGLGAFSNATGFPIGVQGGVDDNGYAVYGKAGIGYGVYGTAPSGVGVGGDSGNVGVAGRGGGDTSGNDTGFPIGVRGSVSNNGFGVHGKAGNGTGVYGTATGGYGVYGVAVSGNGVVGSTSGAGNVAGLYGTSSTTYGIIGNTTAKGYSGLTGITSTPGVAALAASSTTTAAYAAYFSGTTVVQGDFYVVKNPDGTGGGKFAAVAHADGSYRGVYCTESPEPWFEDFGMGKLSGNMADVTLDPEFAALIHTDDYHVFITPRGDFHAHIAQQTPTGFRVAMTTVGSVQGTTSAVGEQTFSWRVVGKRKDIAGTRLPKVDLPKIKTPDMATLLESAKPTTPPKVTARVTPQLPKQTEPPVLPDARQPNPLKKP